MTQLRSALIAIALGLGLALGTALDDPTVAQAKILEGDRTKFKKIEQPLPLKIGIAATGAGLIGLELWWFLYRNPKAENANREQ